MGEYSLKFFKIEALIMANKKIPNKTKRVAIELTLILIFIAIVVISFLSDFSVLPIPSFASLNLSGVEELFVSLFTVQASVATVSIAIVSIITGLVSESILGISVSGFITNRKPVVLKHNRLIIANLIVTALNYVSVAMAFFNVCIALFIISIAITILLVDEVYIIFLGKNRVRQEIHEFVLENYDAEILNDLNNELLSAIEIGNSLTITEDFEIIKRIFKAETIKSNYKSNEIIEQLSKMVCDAFEKTSYKHNGQRINYCLLQICEIYKIANENEDAPLHLNIWNKIVRDIFRALKDIDFEQHRDDFAYYQLRIQLYKNLKGREEKEINESNLKYYSSWIYSTLLSKNNKFAKEEQTYIKRDIYQMVDMPLFYGTFNVGEENINKLLVLEMCNLHRSMIDNGDFEGLKKLFFKNLHYNSEKIQLSLIFTITILYLYYLSSRERLIKGQELQEFARKILSDNHDAIKSFYYYVDIQKVVNEYLPLIQGLLHNWEYMNEGEVKHVVMYHVIDDFIIFMSLDRYWEHDIISNIIEQLSNGSMFPLYDRYFSKDDGVSIKNSYSEFNKIFTREKTEGLLEEKISILHDVFNKRYKLETIKAGDQERITEEQKENFAKLVIEKIEKVNDELKSFNFKNNDNDLIVEKNDTIIYGSILSNYFFQYDGLESHIEDDICTKTITAFIRSFFNNISYKKVTYKEKDKQETLIQMVEELELTPTVAIGNRDEFWGEEEPDILNKYISNMERIKYPGGYNYYFILDSSLIEFSMENIRVEYVDLTWDEIKHKCQENDSGKLSFNVTNNIYIPFTKSEIEQYITNTEKKMLVYADIKVRLKDEKVGAGIEIVSSLSD